MPTTHELLQSTLDFANVAHKGQFRKRPTNGIYIPFVVHPIHVMKTLWDWHMANVVISQAALLHDVIEDTETTEADIAQAFGVDVAKVVVELTFSPTNECMTKHDYMCSFAGKSAEALVIKLADRLCNLHDFRLTTPEHVVDYAREARPLFSAIEDRLGELRSKFGNDSVMKMCDHGREVLTSVFGRTVPLDMIGGKGA